MIRAVITGTGSALPARRVSNDDLAQTVDTTDEFGPSALTRKFMVARTNPGGSVF